LLGWEPEVGRAEGLKITYEYFKSLPADRLKETAHYEFKKYNRA
jgi:dTDP-glucose 4,6-dehydratase